MKSTLKRLGVALILATSLFAGKEPDALAYGNVSKEDVDAIKAFAEKGDVEAQAILSWYYLVGFYGVPHDFKESYKWAKKAAEQGHVGLQHILSGFYSNGDGVRKSKSKSFKWAKKAADKGHPAAQYHTAFKYITGDGVRKNKKEAIKYLKLAAAQGDPNAKGALASEYSNGETLPKDLVRAYQLYKTAAMEGSQTAMIWLSACYSDGLGVPENFIQSYKWLILAISKSENEKERNKLKSLTALISKRMGPNQVAEAQKLASEFKPSDNREYVKQVTRFDPDIDAVSLLKRIREGGKSKR